MKNQLALWYMRSAPVIQSETNVWPGVFSSFLRSLGPGWPLLSFWLHRQKLCDRLKTIFSDLLLGFLSGLYLPRVSVVEALNHLVGLSLLGVGLRYILPEYESIFCSRTFSYFLGPKSTIQFFYRFYSLSNNSLKFNFSDFQTWFRFAWLHGCPCVNFFRVLGL